MSAGILNLQDAPRDPLERLVWLGGVKDAVQTELDEEFASAYFWARFTGRLPEALGLRLHSKKRVMAYTRHSNESRGRAVSSWGDGY